MRKLVVLLLALTLIGCASNQKSNREMTEAEHYQEARALLNRNTFMVAIEQLEELEARFPYGEYAEQAQLDLIYAKFRALDYPATIAQADRFIRTYPANPNLDYVLYLKGMANYLSEQGMFARFNKENSAARDLHVYREAFRDFDELVSRFPDSEYAPDARTRMLFIRQMLAESELHAARYYARRNAFVASANRAQAVIKHYQGTAEVPEALAILALSYRDLEQPELAEKARLVLAHNWPDSEFLDSRQQPDLDWWPAQSRLWLRLITFDLLKW